MYFQLMDFFNFPLKPFTIFILNDIHGWANCTSKWNWMKKRTRQFFERNLYKWKRWEICFQTVFFCVKFGGRLDNFSFSMGRRKKLFFAYQMIMVLPELSFPLVGLLCRNISHTELNGVKRYIEMENCF